MTRHKAGTEIDYSVTFLEMHQRPDYGWPPAPVGMTGALLRADAPPVWYFRALYDAVGGDYAWTDMHQHSEATLKDWLADPDVTLYSLLDEGWPKGFFILDWRKPGHCELDLFGLAPQAVGKGLGSWMLRTAILTGWARDGVTCMGVNTCSLDHPRALIQYQRHGFSVVRQEQRKRMLTRDWKPAGN